MVTARELAPSWLPGHLADNWLIEYTNLGGSSVPNSGTLATEAIRTDPKYQSLYDYYFPGNRRDDGSLRLPEQVYRTRVDSFENALMGVNVNPDVFADKMAGLIEGDVTEAEFTQRVESMYERVIESAPTIRDFYAANFAMDVTDEAIIASFLDPDVGNKMLAREIAVSEIGGEAAVRQFDVGVEFAESLQQAGVTRAESQNLFGQAAIDVPVLSALARRHADPDDTFDLEEFTQAEVFDDPVQRRRMRRLVAQERASFTGGRGALAEDRATGGVTGLTAR